MHKTLVFCSNSGDRSRMADFCLNRHVSCVDLRFRFLVMALSLLDSSSSLIPNTISKWILRESIELANWCSEKQQIDRIVVDNEAEDLDGDFYYDEENITMFVLKIHTNGKNSNFTQLKFKGNLKIYIID